MSHGRLDRMPAGVVLALCLFALLALLTPQSGAAQNAGQEPGKLWEKYPLAPTAAPSASAQPVASVSPTARATVGTRPLGAARAATGSDVPEALIGLLTLLTVGGAMTFWIRRRHETEPHPAAPSLPAARLAAAPAGSALWHGSSERFARATPHTNGSRVPQAIGAVASAAEARAGGDAPRPGAAPDPQRAAPVTEVPAAPAGSPPDRTQAWTAEIEWRHTETESRFCVIARGEGESAVAQSAPLEWPPAGAAAVQAMTDATEELAATLVAAGWKPLPRGSAWYAKRFAWEPVGAEAAPAPPSADATPAAEADAAPDPAAKRPMRQRALRITLLCALIAFGPITALQLRGDNDKPSPVRTTQSPGNGTSGTSSAPAAAKAKGSGVDLTIPVLILLIVVVLVFAIRQDAAREAER